MLPQDIGLGPYDAAYRRLRGGASGAGGGARRTRTVTKPGGRAGPHRLVGVRRIGGGVRDAGLFGPRPGRCLG